MAVAERRTNSRLPRLKGHRNWCLFYVTNQNERCATGHADARTFLEWRARHGLSLSKAAEALGLSRRMVAYYSSGEKPVPKAVLLACRGWEVVEA